MEETTHESLQLAQLWMGLHSIQQKIDNHILPLAHHLGGVGEDAELYAALEVCSEKVRNHFDHFKLCAEKQ